MKVVHFADLHLEAAFAWMGTRDVEAPRRRRDGLRQTLKRIVQLTVDERADALLCGGDLYEHDHFTPDTVEFVRTLLAELHPIPVYIAPGNHDWLGPESLYRQAAWNIALFHGTDLSAFYQQGNGKVPYAPFMPEQIVEAGLHHAFLGHFHTPMDQPTYTYPGNPDPLSFGEGGNRGAVVATIHPDGRVDRVRHRVASIEAIDMTVDVTGCTSVDAIATQVRAKLGEFRGVARITLIGALEPSVDLRLSSLQSAADRLQGVSFRLGKLEHAYDLARLKEDRTVRGQFVQDVLSAGLPQDETRAILATGLRALDGRADLGAV